MANPDIVVTLTALAVSAVALLVAGTQLCAEIFATAEGQRKTTLAVMGRFGKLTVRNLKFKQMRFEVQYVSPLFVLRDTTTAPLSSTPFEARNQVEKDKRLNYGSFYTLIDPRVDDYVALQPGWQRHGWQQLLYQIQSMVRGTGDHHISGRPGIVLQSRPWDSLPDDVGKTVASAELFDILVIARRLGAIWRTGDTAVSELWAEGGGHVFKSTDVRGLGMTFLYQYRGPTKNKVKTKSKMTEWHSATYDKMQAWTSDADKFMFGICPGNDHFDLRDFVIRTIEDLITIWNYDGYLDIPWQKRDAKEDHETSWGELFTQADDVEVRRATNDLIALNCPMIRSCTGSLKANYRGRVLLSFADTFENTFQGYRIEGDHTGRMTFLRKLEEHVSKTNSSHLQKILDHARIVINKEFSGKHIALADLSAWLDDAGRAYHHTTAYFDTVGDRLPTDHRLGETPKDRANNFYWHLMRAHLARSLFGQLTSWHAVRDEDGDKHRSGEERQHYFGRKRVDVFFGEIWTFQEFMKGKGYTDGALVAEAWMVLFFRGMCWSLCHTADEDGAFLPVELYGSRLPVFLI